MRALFNAATASATPVLQPFTQERSPLSRALLKTLFLGLCAFLGIFYGFVFAVFPPFVMVYMALPVIALALVVIWALPDQGRAPDRLLQRLFFLYLVVVVLWPNYLAIQLPGLPWISMRRLIGFPMALILLICLSMSGRFRRELGVSLNAMPAMWKMLVGFVFVQFATIFISRSPFGSLNIFINHVVLSVAVFFIGAWAFGREGGLRKFGNYIVGITLVLCVIGVLESIRQEVLWARHIPSFLAIADESVQRTLAGSSRDGSYRIVTTFTVPLAFAEYLSLAAPFILQKWHDARQLGWKIAYLALDALVLVTIVMTGARLGIVGWLVAHMVWGCLWAYRRWKASKFDVLGPALAIAVPVAGAIFSVAMFTVDAVKYRTIGGGSTQYSDQARWDQLDGTWPLVLKNPLGYGMGMGGETLGFRTPGGLLTVDTYLVTLLLDTGIAGFVLFVGIFGYALVKMLKLSLRHRSPEIDQAMAICAAIAAYLVIRLVLAQDDNAPLVYMLIGAATAVAMKARLFDAAESEAEGAAAPAARPARAARRAKPRAGQLTPA